MGYGITGDGPIQTLEHGKHIFMRLPPGFLICHRCGCDYGDYIPYECVDKRLSFSTGEEVKPCRK